MNGPHPPARARGGGAAHEISWIDDGRILLMVLRGFWDAAAASSFERDVRSALATASGRPFHAVCDATRMTVQSTETQLRIRAILGEMRSAGMAAGAMVVESALLRLQVGRTVDPDRTSYFPDRFKALAWARGQFASGEAAASPRQ